MTFICKDHLNNYLNNIEYLGQGSQGVCYVDRERNIVVKIFHDYFDNEECGYSFDDIIKHNFVKNKTFIWATDVIIVDGNIVGCKMPYIQYKNLYETDPLRVNLDSFAKGILSAESDIKLLTEKNIRIFDIMYNILYKSGKFKVIDTMEYGNAPTQYEANRRGFDLEIMKFLVDNYFNYFVLQDTILSDMYLSHGVSGYEFLTALRHKISEYLGFEVTTLNQVKSLVRRIPTPKYERNIH